MVTPSTVLGSTFSSQRICRPRCARGDDRAGGDNRTGVMLVPCDVLGMLGGHIPVCPAVVPCAPEGRWSRVLRWHRSPPCQRLWLLCTRLAAGNSLPRKVFAGSLSRNDAAGSRHSSPSAWLFLPLLSCSSPWWIFITLF